MPLFRTRACAKPIARAAVGLGAGCHINTPRGRATLRPKGIAVATGPWPDRPNMTLRPAPQTT
jgi:hypothetical protein